MKIRQKTKARPPTAPKKAASPPPGGFRIGRIMVPIDFSEHSKNALSYAVSFAAQFHAELVLIYVVEPTIYPADFSFGQVAIPNIEDEMVERGKTELGALVENYIKGTLPSRTMVRIGKPFLEIINTAQEESVDLIIIATHGHTGMEHLLFGSTAEKVVRKAPCPVLTVRSSESAPPAE
jgi:nucleotide-binding universal stress UspA family protein